jgi:hypothetical protein
MPAQRINLTIDEGSDFYQNLIFTDADENRIDVSNFIFSGKIKKQSSESVDSQFTFSTINATEGEVLISLMASSTDTLTRTWPGDVYEYDVFLKNTDNGAIFRVFYGNIKVNQSISQFTT